MNEIYSEEPAISADYPTELRNPTNQVELQFAVFHSLAVGKMWLNGYHTLQPSDAFLKDLGATVLTLLNNPANCLPSLDWNQKNPQAPLSQAQRDNVALYLKIVKS